MGETALIITKTINNALLPLAAVNFAFDKARIYFSEKFQEDISDKASDIPLERLVDPKALIAGPTLQALAFTHEEVNLKDMFISLLVTAMDGNVADDAHPAFVEIIKQLSAEEAGLIRGFLSSSTPIPMAELRLNKFGEHGYRSIAKHVINMIDEVTKRPVENIRYPAMIDNWIRLGLFEANYTIQLLEEGSYSWLDSRPELKKCRMEYEMESQSVTIQNGILTRTALGLQFAKAVGII